MKAMRTVLTMSLVLALMGALFAAPAAAGPKGRRATLKEAAATAVNSTVGSSAPDIVLYEVTEAVGSKRGNQPGFKSSVATLSGVARTGTAPCPAAIAGDAFNGCWVVVRATGRADDTTGIGPVIGSFEVVVQDKYAVDAPEIVVLRGTINGEIDLSPAFMQNRPLGTITGTYTLRGVPGTAMNNQAIRGSFTGTFRLPFNDGGIASYLVDGGGTIPVEPGEHVLGYPAVKLEVTLR